jgi:GH35 family endo-1,4-beta-xylanase
MIRFTTCSNNPNAGELLNAHLLTRDNHVIPGSVSLEENGVIAASAPGHTSFALCLLYDAGKAGRLMLQTAILPPRNEPYMLALELARHRIKSFLDLSENWSLFYLSDDNPAVQRWEESRLIFTKALVSIDHEEIGKLARRALELSIDASERLTMAHAQILLHKRYSRKPASAAALGVQVHTSRFDAPLRSMLDKNFKIIKIPMQWAAIEPEEGKFDWEPIDKWVKWAQENQKHVIGGPLLDFTKEDAIPSWVTSWEHDYSVFRDKCYDHIERVIHRYGGAVSFWNLTSGINLNRHVRISIANMVDLIRMARLIVRQTRKDARIMVELAEPFSEFVSTNSESCNAKVFLARLSQEGVALDALGVQCLVGGPGGRSTRDLMLMSAKLDEFLHADIPLIISALGTPSVIIDEKYGWWKTKWDEIRQEEWASSMLAICLSKPFVDSVIWTDLFDNKDMDLPTAGFISQKGKPRLVLNKMLSMRKRLCKPLGALELPKKNKPSKDGL